MVLNHLHYTKKNQKPKAINTKNDKTAIAPPKSFRLPKTPNQYNSLIILNFN